MTKLVRIIALIMAILMGLSAIGMIAMYVAAETYDGTSSSISLSGEEFATFAANPIDGVPYILANDIF